MSRSLCLPIIRFSFASWFCAIATPAIASAAAPTPATTVRVRLLAMFHSTSCIRAVGSGGRRLRSEEHTSELQSLMRISYAVFCLQNKNQLHYPLHHKLLLRTVLL